MVFTFANTWRQVLTVDEEALNTVASHSAFAMTFSLNLHFKSISLKCFADTILILYAKCFVVHIWFLLFFALVLMVSILMACIL